MVVFSQLFAFRDGCHNEFSGLAQFLAGSRQVVQIPLGQCGCRCISAQRGVSS